MKTIASSLFQESQHKVEMKNKNSILQIFQQQRSQYLLAGYFLLEIAGYSRFEESSPPSLYSVLFKRVLAERNTSSVLSIIFLVDSNIDSSLRLAASSLACNLLNIQDFIT